MLHRRNKPGRTESALLYLVLGRTYLGVNPESVKDARRRIGYAGARELPSENAKRRRFSAGVSFKSAEGYGAFGATGVVLAGAARLPKSTVGATSDPGAAS